nr:zinc finger BED domain-containing protein RICESLEEPER 2-like [Tanacetum cinerariifolium]
MHQEESSSSRGYNASKQMFNLLVSENRKRDRGNTPNSEIGRYEASDFLSQMTIQDLENLDILSWWKELESQIPVLVAMTHDLLSVQASRVAFESAFLSGWVRLPKFVWSCPNFSAPAGRPFREKNLYNCDPNAYSFDNSNYFPRPQYKNYLCNLCGNNSHDGYDCQQQFQFVYEKEPSYNKNYDCNYYSHDLPSFPCYDNCGGSHETFQCQPIDQNIDFSGSDQIQTAQYPEIHPPSQEISNEVFQANHSIQNKESLENSSNEIAVSNSNQEKEEPSQDSDIRKLIREECCVKVSEEQKQSMEDTMLELVKICQEKEFLCIHDDVDDLIESALNSKLLLINSNSQRLEKEQQEVKNVVEQPAERGNRSIQSLQNFRVVHKSFISFKNTSQISSIHAIAPILSTKEPEHLLSMGYGHLSITPETESDEVTYVEEENGVEEENIVQQEEEKINLEDIYQIQDIDLREKLLSITQEKIDLEDISQIQDIDLREKLLSITRLISNIESLNSTLDRVLNSFESDNFLLDNFSPEFETFYDHSEETRSGTLLMLITFFPNMIRFALRLSTTRRGDIGFLEELLIDDSILSHESSDSNFEDNPSIPRPPLEPPDAETDAGEEIPVVINNKDKFDENDDLSYFMFVIFAKDLPPVIEVFLC